MALITEPKPVENICKDLFRLHGRFKEAKSNISMSHRDLLLEFKGLLSHIGRFKDDEEVKDSIRFMMDSANQIQIIQECLSRDEMRDLEDKITQIMSDYKGIESEFEQLPNNLLCDQLLSNKKIKDKVAKNLDA